MTDLRNDILKTSEMEEDEEEDENRGEHEDEIEEQYKQIKRIHKSYSDPNLLASTARSIRRTKRSQSAPYQLKDFRGSNGEVMGKNQYYSLCCLGPRNPIRALATLITESKLFEYFILLAILFTCVVMAIDAPLPENDKSEMNKIANQIEYYLLGIFCCEAVLKILAMGLLLHPHSYLRSVWNILDFVVVVTGLLTVSDFLGSKVNIKPLRAVRVLRPLKLISGIPSLQVVMTSIVRAMFPLLQVLFLVVFVIIIYAIIGLEFFVKRFHYSCYSNDTKTFDNFPCDSSLTTETFYYVHGRKCPENRQCMRYWTGLNYGITSFDNIFLAMITVFQCITMEGWTEIMYHTFYSMDESGYIYAIYYISLIVIGSFFMLNLVLGVLSGEFAKEREKVENRRAFLKLRYEQQLDRICEAYLNWILKGEDALVQEQSEQNVQSTEAMQDINESVIVNPALVFTSSREYRVKIGDHHKSKFDRLMIRIKMMRIKLRAIVKHNYFFWFVVFMVFINTIIMATRHYQQPDWLTDVQQYAEIVFVSIFTLELIIKLFSHGFVLYCRSLFNVFDLVVVVLSIMEIILNKTVGDINLGLSVLRCLRLLRVFKVTKYWSSLRNLVTSLMNAMKSILSLMFLLFLFIVISALLGMQLFGGKFVKLKIFPRTNFDTFSDSLLAVFQVITGEDWNTVMYDGMMAYGGPKTVEGVLCSLYFIFLVIFGNYTLLNVFLAIAVDNLTNAEILTHDEEAEENKKRTAQLTNLLEANQSLSQKANVFVNNLQSRTLKDDEDTNSSSSDGGINLNGNAPRAEADLGYGSKEEIHKNVNANGNAITTSPTIVTNGNALPILSTPNTARRGSHGMFEQVLLNNEEDKPNKVNAEKYINTIQKKWLAIVDYNTEHPDAFINPHAQNGSRKSSVASYADDEQRDTDSNELKSDEEDIEEQIQHQGMLNVLKVNVTNRRRIIKAVPMVQKSSLYIFSPQNRFRIACHKIVHFRYFDWFIMAVILMSSITLAIEDPVNDNANINKILHYFDYFFTIVFGIEVLLKIIDNGLILHKDAYLRNPWNMLDAFVFACNLTSIILSRISSTRNASQIIKTLRVLRVLRPIKAIHKVKKLKAVFQCMVYSLKNVTFVLIITFIILFIFACIGVQLFQGKFFYCTDPSKMTREECQGSYYVFPNATSVVKNSPEVRERIWKRYDYHFDNIVEALLTLYTSSTGEGWPTSMHHTMDATEVDKGPITSNNPHMAIYYIIFVVIFTFMIINIYIALIILTFQRQGEKEIEGGLDRNQRDCLQFVMNANPRQRYMPANKNSLSYRVWYIVDSSPFEYFIMTLIILNTVQLMMKYDGNPEPYKEMLRSLNIAFTALFCIEAALKIIAYRLNYFKDLWNLFDIAVILGSLLDIILTYKSANLKFIDPSMFRLCRAARIVKLLRKGASIRVMLWTFLQSFKALPYVTALIMLLFYIYAIVGMQTFGKIKLDNDTHIHKYNNFQGIIQALQVLLRCSTGESWSSLMSSCYSDAPCEEKYHAGQTGCGNTWLARAYFSSFIFFCMFLLLNLFVAVIMDNFEYLTRDSSILGPHHLDEFVRCWSEFDPSAIGSIPHELLYSMLCHLSPPVGFGKRCPKEIAYKRLIRMNMPIQKNGTVSFHTTLLALIRTSLDIYVKGNMFDNDKELRRILTTLWPKASTRKLEKILPKLKPGDDSLLTVGKIYCVQLIVMKYRSSKMKGFADAVVRKKESPSVLKRLNTLLSSFRKSRGKKPANVTPNGLELKTNSNVKRHQTFSAVYWRKKMTQHDNPHHTRDKQLRRRSSWSDLPSFFKFNKESNIATTQSGKDPIHKDVPTKTVVSASNAATKTNSLSPTYNKTSKQHLPIVSRTPSLRTNSNGNVIVPHRRTAPGQSLQYDSINKASSVRYQPNKPVATRPLYSHSAPTTPRGSHGAVHLQHSRQNGDLRHQSQGSPSARRINQSFSVPVNASHRRVASHSGSGLVEINSRDPHYMNNYKQSNYSNDPRHDSRVDSLKYDFQHHDSRPRTLSDPRKTQHYRQELSKENLETFNHYDGGQYEPPSDRRNYRDSTTRTSRYVLDSRHGTNQSDNRVALYPHEDNSSDNNSNYEYRASIGDAYRTHGGQASPQKHGYRTEYMTPMMNDNQHRHQKDRRPYSPRRNGNSIGDRTSPRSYYANDNELLNGMPSQQYYDSMISQINNQIARVSEGGVASQQPFKTVAGVSNVATNVDDDDNEWC
ncbi:voltage-dependent calcium channel type A subunit alpha-1-like isoform X2 [Hydractinia symbiolongicarpus]|uniref:voltage-dependent calcium channel type A subunit alpha-1-like isoform X2 n=1 Tax=Hydractinia symbiolongicarpus TaxID=13093 RepID=UPI002550FD50|nr:voltage-dependent calcium channel type A subunit alpha-1-like isoform X2 [Hydractinia symbiolongicarpus]